MQKAQLKEQPLYRDLLRGALEITWHRRELWLLGLLASLLMMNGGAFEFIVRAVFKIASGAPFSGGIQYFELTIDGIAYGDTATRASLFFSILIGLSLFALGAILAIAASGGLLSAAAKKALKKPVSLRGAFGEGMEKLGPLVLTQLLGRITIFCTYILASLGMYLTFESTGSIILAIALFVAFSATALAVSFLMMMTNAGIMIGKDGWINAAHNACRFFRRHWLVSLEMIGLVFIVALAASILTIAAGIVLLVPFALIVVALAALHLSATLPICLFVYGIVILALFAAVGSMLAVFNHSAWSLLYVRLADRGATAKLERLWQIIKKAKSHARSAKR